MHACSFRHVSNPLDLHCRFEAFELLIAAAVFSRAKTDLTAARNPSLTMQMVWSRNSTIITNHIGDMLI
jgi:hypothetical protein